MFFEITNERKKWKEFYKLFSSENRDIYFSDDYCFLHEANNEGKAYAALYKNTTGAIILYPFLIKQIKGYVTGKAYYDIESCYGYGGPMSEKCTEADTDMFEDIFCSWCRDNNIVSEFIRFHPLLENHLIFNRTIIKEKNRQTVYIDLSNGIESVWNNSLSSKNRNMIRKAEKLGVTVSISDDWSAFISIYNSTMKKVNADGYYYFSDGYFREMEGLKTGEFLLEARLAGKTIASSVFLYSSDFLHYHLSGSEHEYLGYAPNNLLLLNAAKIGIEMGLKKFHLGGGTSGSGDDNLLKFKKSFSKDTLTFYIGKRVHNKDMYSSFMDQWVKMSKSNPVLFHQYHYLGG